MNSINLFSEFTYTERRKTLKRKVGSGVIVLLGNEESSINFKDNWYSFRQDSTFLYYFGLSISGLTAVIDIDRDEEIIFGDEMSIEDVIWTGALPTLHSLAERVGVRKVSRKSQIKEVVAASSRLHLLPPYRPEHEIKLAAWTGLPVDQLARKISPALIEAVVAQRAVKSDEEVEEIQKAVTISAQMHLQVMKAARAGMRESDLVGEAYKVVASAGVPLAFPIILTTQGQILHNHYHGHVLTEGNLVLCDGGAESPKGYAGDLTRTFPAGQKFSERQKEIYQVVLNAHERVIACLRPGVLFRDMHLLACRDLVEGLKSLGLMKGDSDEAVNAGAHTMFFQCGLGHMMGLDVHDMESLGEEYVGYRPGVEKSKEFGLKSLRLGKELKPGNVLTVEPGIYFIPELIDKRRADKTLNQFVNFDLLDTYKDFGGIRVEDDFLITENGANSLGEALPRSISEIEAVRQL